MQIYSNNVSAISDSDIAKVNSIFLGLPSVDLSRLVFHSMSSLSTLGALSEWTADQVIFII